MELIIDRTKWARGGRNGIACLLNEQDTMCCMGFLAIKLGLADHEILNKAEWEDLGGNADPDTQDVIEHMAYCPVGEMYDDDCGGKGFATNDFHDSAVSINDGDWPEQEREELLIKLFADQDIALEFTGEFLHGN